MPLDISRVPLHDILSLRALYREEMRCQIVHDSWHERGFTDSYLFQRSGRVIGYGSVGAVGSEPRDMVKEFYLLLPHRARAGVVFRDFVAVSGAKRVEAQTNDVLLTLMLLDTVGTVERDRILFSDAFTTNHRLPECELRRLSDADRSRVFIHQVEPVGEWGLEVKGEIVATGGLTFHYNPPYSDVYMEVAPAWRRRGYGSFLVQELKRVSYELGRVPAARCNAENQASRATLERAGLLPCARILSGRIDSAP